MAYRVTPFSVWRDAAGFESVTQTLGFETMGEVIAHAVVAPGKRTVSLCKVESAYTAGDGYTKTGIGVGYRQGAQER
jgi:hypothetical protein